MNKMIIMACVALGYFLLLYLVAFVSNLHYRSDEDVLWVPCLIGIVLGAKK